MKQYNCPDCTHIEDTCENCTRYQENYKTNLDKNNQYPWWPYYNYTTFSFTDIPLTCRNCPNHPSNGGSGICHCILGTQSIY